MHHFIAICGFKLESGSGNGKVGSWPLWPWPWPLTLIFCMDITSVMGNNSWKFYDDTMRGTYWKRCEGQTDRQMDGRTDGLNHSESGLVTAKKTNKPYKRLLSIPIHILRLWGSKCKHPLTYNLLAPYIHNQCWARGNHSNGYLMLYLGQNFHE